MTILFLNGGLVLEYCFKFLIPAFYSCNDNLILCSFLIFSKHTFYSWNLPKILSFLSCHVNRQTGRAEKLYLRAIKLLSNTILSNAEQTAFNHAVCSCDMWIDKQLKQELRETAYDMWMQCYSTQEIADNIGFSKSVVGEFTNLLQSSENETEFVSGQSSENDQLTESLDNREFQGEHDKIIKWELLLNNSTTAW